MVLVVSLKRRWSRTGEDPLAVYLFKKAGRHGGAWADGLRINDPSFHPIGLQTFLGQQEVGRCSGAIVSRIAGGVALEAGRGRAAEKTPRHLGFFRRQHL